MVASDEAQERVGGGLGSRHMLVFMGFLGLATVYLLRINLNVAIVAMVTLNQTKNDSGDCPVPHRGSGNTTTIVKVGEFDWSPYDQNIILSSIYYGYVVSSLFGGPLAERFGGKLIFGLSILVTALLTLLTPAAARYSMNALIVLRVLEGIVEGLSWPSMHTICGHWLPSSERGFLYSVTHTGAEFGTVIGYPIAGALSASSFLGGWPATFYIFGCLGIVWFGFWWLLVFETPSQHPRISEEEKLFILKNIEHPTTTGHWGAPWRKILLSVPVWAVALTSFLTHWTFEMIFVDLSSYLSSVLHFDVKTNGLLSSLPHLLHVLVQWTGGYLADFMVNRGFGKTGVRKGINLFSCLLAAVCFGGAIAAGCNSTWVFLCIVVGTGSFGLNTPSFNVALLDMAPDYAGTLMGFANGLGNIASFISPIVIGILTNNGQTRQQWNTGFYISIGLSLLAGLVFTVFGSSELQPWAKLEQASVSPESNNHEIKLHKMSPASGTKL